MTEVTKEECVERGGHFWNYSTEGDIVDSHGKTTGLADLLYRSHPRNRRQCGLCGLKQVEIPTKWEEV